MSVIESLVVLMVDICLSALGFSLFSTLLRVFCILWEIGVLATEKRFEVLLSEAKGVESGDEYAA